MNFYQLDLENLLVVYDDLDLAPGFLRIKGSGSAGGHRGMADIIQRLGSDGFPACALASVSPAIFKCCGLCIAGIDGPERKILEDAAERASEAAEMWLHRDITAVMNLYNRRQAQTDEI